MAVQLQIISLLFQRCALQVFKVAVPDDLPLVLKASELFSNCNQSNVLYVLAQALGRMRPEGSDIDSRLPAI